MNSRSHRLAPALCALLALNLAACLRAPEAEVEKGEAARRAAITPTPTPTPKPGAWMHEKRPNPLGVKDSALQEKPTK